MTITAEQLVAREVHYCVSSLVSTLASGYGAVDGSRGAKAHGDLSDATEQAMELCSPILDYEDAARDAGFERSDAGHLIRYPTDRDAETADSWEEACEIAEVEPYEREVYEHWIVSDWLADHLAKRGEKVDKDFCGLTVWARTTTGQAIANDYVIDDILRELSEG
jgi:hypothetical protein